MADLLDDLIGISKEFKSLGEEFSSETAEMRGATTSDGKAAPVWSPSDYKVVPKVNASLCVRCKDEDASCDLCQQVCPVDAIEFTDDGDIEIGPSCRKCGLCVAACPTDAMMSSLYNPRTIYDKICKIAESHEMCYVTCTRALGHAPEDAEVVLPCVGAISAEVWYAILCEYGNVGVYLPRGICEKCRTRTGEDFYTEQISCGESWSGETVDLVEKERNLILEVDHQVERKQFVSNSMKTLGMTASKVNPVTAKLARAAEKLSEHSKQITQLQKTLDRMTGGSSTAERKRLLTGTRQLLLVALSNHPETATNILFDLPYATDACDGCGDCADACPTSAIDVVDGKAKVLSTHCVSCSLCADVCQLDAIDFMEADGTRLIVDDPEAQKKIEEDEKARKQKEEARQKGREMGKKALDFLEAEADREDAEEEAARRGSHKGAK
ncbi:4Fe-4S binding protein [bacterium]|nr:4Fe-4S binding protein [bacterium]